MRRPLAPLRTTAALALSLSLALTACGSDDAEPDAAKDDTSTTTSSSPSAADEDGGEKPAKAAGEKKTEGGGEKKPSKASSDKKAGDTLSPEEFAHLLATSMERGRTARITASGSGMVGTTMDGVVDYTRKQPAMRLKVGGTDQAGLQTEMIMVGGAVYMQMGVDGQYVKMNLDEMGDDIGRVDPGANLSSFSSGISELTYVGEEKVGKEKAHHYLAKIDTAKLGNDTPIAEAGAEKLDYHVWLGDDDLVRKFSIDLGKDGLGAMEMTFSDWGMDVEIKAPAKAKVTEMPALPSSPSS